MKKTLLGVILCAILVGTGGCIISIKGDGCNPVNSGSRHMEPDPTIAEIDAALTLTNEAARLNVLLAIASRPGLSPQARLHIVESVLSLPTESDREDVLMSLAKNPPLPPAPMPCDDDDDAVDDDD